MSTTYLRDADNGYSGGRIYGATDNPSVQQAESLIAALEGADDAFLFGSGMAAASAVFQALDRPTHIIASRVMYWGLRTWLGDIGHGHSVSFVDSSDLDAVREAVRPGETGLFWIETPSNPLWTITDIAAIADIAHSIGAVLCVDSTVSTPIFTRPIAFGADIVVHSATKYLNGHSDVMAGVLATAERSGIWDRIRKVRAQIGATLGPFEAWLLMRGIRTLHVRVKAQSETAAMLASRLVGHPALSGSISRPQEPCGPSRCDPPDDRRFWRHDVDPREGRRAGGRRRGGTGQAVEARDIARRRRKPDRAPRVDRGRRNTLPVGSASPLGGPRGYRRSVPRSCPGFGTVRRSGMGSVAVGIMCKTPAPGKSKTRLSPPLRPEECAGLSACFIRDLSQTIARLAEDGDVTGYAVYTPVGSEEALRRLLPAGFN
jgi:hypothetical protein